MWLKLVFMYKSQSLSNKIYLKQKLYDLNMEASSNRSYHIKVLNWLINDLSKIHMKYDDEDKALILLNSLQRTNAYQNIHTTLTWSKQTMDFEDAINDLLEF